MPKLPIVKVANKNAKDGFIIINESDFDSKKHTLFNSKPKASPKAKAAKK